MKIDKNIASKAALVLGGLAIGGGSGYFVGVKRTRREYQEVLDQELLQLGVENANLRAEMAELRSKMNEVLKAKQRADERAEEAETPKEVAEQLVEELKETSDVIKKELYKSEGDEENDIYQITPEAFMAAAEYDSEVRTYYAEDEVFVDEGDNVINGFKVDFDIEKAWAEAVEDELDYIYARDEKNQIDYPIQVLNLSYSKEVLGLGNDFLEHSDKPRRGRKMKREWDD